MLFLHALETLGTIVLFLLMLVVLVSVHELGHFFMAKLARIRVEEFGIGFPPRALTFWKKGETIYTLNWLPIGGFVRIYGEDGVDGEREHPGRAFTDKNRFIQACVLLAGVAMNVLFAYVLISLTFVGSVGSPRPLSDVEAARTPGSMLVVQEVLPGSPAEDAGVQMNDRIKQTIINGTSLATTSGAAFADFVANAPAGTPVTLDLIHNGSEEVISAIPRAGSIAGQPDRRALGLAVGAISPRAEAWYDVPLDGAQLTWTLLSGIAVGLAHLIASAFTLQANLNDVSGPIGIEGIVGTAAHSGLISLTMLTAYISLNLALINLLPIPALDGGRVLFVLIESVTRRRINARLARSLNAIFFYMLIALVVLISVHDVYARFG